MMDLAFAFALPGAEVPRVLAAWLGIEPIVWLLPLVAVYAIWRGIHYARKKRWVIVVPIACVVVLCIFEFVGQVLQAQAAPVERRSVESQTDDDPAADDGAVRGAPEDLTIGPPLPDNPPPPPEPRPSATDDESP